MDDFDFHRIFPGFLCSATVEDCQDRYAFPVEPQHGADENDILVPEPVLICKTYQPPEEADDRTARREARSAGLRGLRDLRVQTPPHTDDRVTSETCPPSQVQETSWPPLALNPRKLPLLHSSGSAGRRSMQE